MPFELTKVETLRALHDGDPFVIPNPWDVGSARVLAALGFKALATTSSGFAFTLGRLDGAVTLDEVVTHTAALTAATDLPLSVDIENGYGPDPSDAATRSKAATSSGTRPGSCCANATYGLLSYASNDPTAADSTRTEVAIGQSCAATACSTAATRLGSLSAKARCSRTSRMCAGCLVRII